ncbi:SixA phosphatase family protein [Shimia sp. FJ5]|uniref:SixA phosphatase family protein n=1 Tax=Shimia sp. FJ5 TaxID=3079054 RepID=UPI002638FEB0|nr:histidine phosphatase family protein [Shimia sp. FJ5]MDV4143234.1 histidine phosphatase family protein [Shimia sp. FJ5]
MTLRLILMRHAKSSWRQTDLADHERTLNQRGRDSADAIGDWLRKNDYAPDTVLSSSSERTRETYAHLRVDAKPTYTRKLYLAPATAMLDCLREASGDTVLMLGHNPGIGEFAERLAKKIPEHSRFLDYPTCATTVFEFKVDRWQDIQLGKGKVRAFIVPRELL